MSSSNGMEEEEEEGEEGEEDEDGMREEGDEEEGDGEEDEDGYIESFLPKKRLPRTSDLYNVKDWRNREIRRLQRSHCCLTEMLGVYIKLTDPLESKKAMLDKREETFDNNSDNTKIVMKSDNRPDAANATDAKHIDSMTFGHSMDRFNHFSEMDMMFHEEEGEEDDDDEDEYNNMDNIMMMPDMYAHLPPPMRQTLLISKANLKYNLAESKARLKHSLAKSMAVSGHFPVDSTTDVRNTLTECKLLLTDPMFEDKISILRSHAHFHQSVAGSKLYLKGTSTKSSKSDPTRKTTTTIMDESKSTSFMSPSQILETNKEEIAAPEEEDAGDSMDLNVERRNLGLQRKFQLFRLTIEVIKEAGYAPYLRIARPRILDEPNRRRHQLQITRTQVKSHDEDFDYPVTVAYSIDTEKRTNSNFILKPPKMVRVWTQTVERGSVVVQDPNNPQAVLNKGAEQGDDEDIAGVIISGVELSPSENLLLFESDEDDSDLEDFELTDIPTDASGNPIGKTTGICHYCRKEILPFPAQFQMFRPWDPKQFYCCDKYKDLHFEVEAFDHLLRTEQSNQPIDISPHGRYNPNKKFPGFGITGKKKVVPGGAKFQGDSKKRKKKDGKGEAEELKSKLTSLDSGIGGKSDGRLSKDKDSRPSKLMLGKSSSKSSVESVDSLVLRDREAEKLRKEEQEERDRAAAGAADRTSLSSTEGQGSSVNLRLKPLILNPSAYPKDPATFKKDLKLKGQEMKAANIINPKMKDALKVRQSTSNPLFKQSSNLDMAHRDVATDTDDLEWDPYLIKFGHPRMFAEGVFEDPSELCYRHPVIVLTQTELYDQILNVTLSGTEKPQTESATRLKTITDKISLYKR